MSQFNFLENIISNFEGYPERNAFCINDKYYTYLDLSKKTADIQTAILNASDSSQYWGVVLNNDMETYASILAIWFSGRAFIPVNPGFPVERNQNIIKQIGLSTILYSSLEGVEESLFSSCDSLDTINLPRADSHQPVLVDQNPEADLYVLFTSGSTGTPKGVRLSILNLNAFVRDFIDFPSYDFTPEDRFLQIYDLSFDASIHCYVVPLVVGATVYTVPQDEIKYLAAYKLMLNHKLTFIKMPPSTLSYLKPYFSTINLPDLKYCLLGGEAFPAMLARDWELCVPNALIQNVYGPTEATINCLIYNWNEVNRKNKEDNGPDGPVGTDWKDSFDHHDGISIIDQEGEGVRKSDRENILKKVRKEYKGTVSIGKAFGTNRAFVLNEDLNPVDPWETGELLISGEQISPGYWNNRVLNETAFIEIESEGNALRLYKTGDLVTVDEYGDIMYLSRKDEQVQVQGYRVELGEIELLARRKLGGLNVIAIGKESEPGQMRIYLIVETVNFDQESLIEYLIAHLPHYMVPAKLIALPEFPLLVSGKLDRKALYKMIPDN